MNSLREFLKLESATGLLLVGAAALALVVANTGLSPLYDELLDVPIEVRVGALGIAKPLLLWVNDGLMAVFFLLVALELKRELFEGELAGGGRIALPLAAAAGGMALPVAIYSLVNLGDSIGARGWAIPAATDIAFMLAVVALLGSRVPIALKVFLTAIAIIDDAGAILIIAVFYTADLSLWSLSLAGFGLLGLLALNLAGVARPAPYVLIGMFIWVCVLKSGVHATLAGVALGLAIPLKTRGDPGTSPLRHLEHVLHPWVAYMIVPLFGFANAGVGFAGIGVSDLVAPVPLGIVLGLFIGKQLGVFGAAWLVVRAGVARLPAGVSWAMLHGGAVLCGIGFTMSLFIGTLAFESAPPVAGTLDPGQATRLGVLAASVVSALVGYGLLARACRRMGPAAEMDLEDRA
ncbi:MAG: Na+/H+ antiporter NhaA [Alphaproteobacteria bacterium]